MTEKKFSWIMLIALVPAIVSAQTIQANEYIVWGIGNDQLDIPAGSVITEAVLTIENVTPANTPLYVHLLDNTEKGLQIGTDGGAGDVFDSYGVLLSGAYENGSYVCRFRMNEDASSAIRAIFPNPASVTLADSSTVQLSSAVLNLIDYAGNAGGFGIGIDSVANVNYSIEGIKLAVTFHSYTSQTAPEGRVFTCDLTGLSAYWSMDDNADSTGVIDSGQYGLDGATLRKTNLLANTGVVGGSFEFDGVSDYIQVSPHEAINQYGQTSFAVSAWIYPRSMGEGGEGRILCKRGNGYDFYLAGASQVCVYIPHTNKAACRISANEVILLNTWQHVMFVYNEDGDKAIKLYINGVLQKSGFNESGQGDLSDDRSNSLMIGRYRTNVRHFDGYLDDVKIFRQAISGTSIKRIYHEGLTSACLSAYWSMDNNDISSMVTDDSGFGLTGTSDQNTALLANTGVAGGSLEFNGISDYIQVASNEAINQYNRTSFAVSAWIYPRSMGEGGEGRILSKRGNGYDFYLTGLNQLCVYIPHAEKAALRISAKNAITLNTWQHVMFVYNEEGDQSVKLYINGVLHRKGTCENGSGLLADDRTNNLVIGRYRTSVRQFDGYIDEVQIFNQALTGSQAGFLHDQITAMQ